jgi:hypothetical protein
MRGGRSTSTLSGIVTAPLPRMQHSRCAASNGHCSGGITAPRGCDGPTCRPILLPPLTCVTLLPLVPPLSTLNPPPCPPSSTATCCANTCRCW